MTEFRSRPGEAPQKTGRRWERFWAKLFGVEPQKGSGNVWFSKLDVADGSITWSLKWTTKESFSISKALLQEARNGVYKNGDNSIPGMAVALDSGSEVVVVLSWDDFARLLAQNQSGYIVPSRADQKRALSQIPSLLRDDGD